MSFFYRCYHFALKCIVLFIGIPNPRLYTGYSGFTLWLKSWPKEKPLLVVSDTTLVKLGVLDEILNLLDEQTITWHLYNDVAPNPTIDNVENGLATYNSKSCTGIIAIGGGSVIDCAKLIAARSVKPKKSIKQLKGLFKVLKRLPPLCAIPTTAGTGSETTVAAVVNDPNAQQKYAATDFTLVPSDAVLIPELTQSVPAHITATTGIDALTHAIEAYIGINGLTFSNERSLQAIDLILKNLLIVHKKGDDLAAREKMLLASFYAGQAFTRASVGYVHAIAHQFGAHYGTPHGLANSVVLMSVLRFYGSTIDGKLADIADYCQLTCSQQTRSEKAAMFLATLEQLLTNLAIPLNLKEIKRSDIPLLAKSAIAEANWNYPVAKFMSEAQCQMIINEVTIE
ncbi:MULTISPECIES: iron-containing alcohol dehydrogenase [Pseudoalteromonas]|uniref:Iron-containing alcohol dehydrogenase n=1 Tax=Pseudoalteromonas haloplanktis TaxID=228 RepID=A0ABU1B766_PSEHA|nr:MULTISPECIES: iron-containing alcohol dehydrogenase [Pseudoalteromonas]MCF6146439.1 alcohol dehydrogenase [Pseudoalteromonas mariniglutinosa NCIMB 1770]MDQ9090393.1 iron-containing alcohol dehydrogenase [Pseudoalteromonas haloplanktis]TMN72517.1 alcohol dehydrogenase [Pseudoalteromonas sp. S1727]